MATHLFNAMSPFGHREPGAIGAVLTDGRVTAGLIADGVHSHPAALRLAFQAKGPDRIALVTDMMAAAGMPPGTYRLGIRLLELGSLVKSRISVRQEALPHMQQLQQALGETVNLSVRHEAYDGSKLGTWRFAQRYSESFRNESFGSRAGRRQATSPECQERYVEAGGLPLRAVMCMTAYKKLEGLYDMSLLVATLDQSTGGVQGRFDVHGVSFDNALKLGAHYMQGFGWQPATKTGSR